MSVIEERSLACRCPELVEEWHPERNGDLTPSNVLAGSTKKAWWKCRQNSRHIWQSQIKSRARGVGCPLCYDEKQLDLSLYPKVLALFDCEKNEGIDPKRITYATVMWWRCPSGPDHSWQGKFNKAKRCPYCANKKASITNSLKSLYPKVAEALHPTKNGEITAEKITAFASKKVWWICQADPSHVWQTSVNNRTRLESGCPECWNLRRSGALTKELGK